MTKDTVIVKYSKSKKEILDKVEHRIDLLEKELVIMKFNLTTSTNHNVQHYVQDEVFELIERIKCLNIIIQRLISDKQTHYELSLDEIDTLGF